MTNEQLADQATQYFSNLIYKYSMVSNDVITIGYAKHLYTHSSNTNNGVFTAISRLFVYHPVTKERYEVYFKKELYGDTCKVSYTSIPLDEYKAMLKTFEKDYAEHLAKNKILTTKDKLTKLISELQELAKELP